MRLRIYQITQIAEAGDNVSRAYDYLLFLVAVISVIPAIFTIFQGDPVSMAGSFEHVLLVSMHAVDVITVFLLFTDWVLRWITHDIKRCASGKTGGIKSFLIYPFTPFALITFASLLPTLFTPLNSIVFLCLLRLVYVLRVSKGFQTVSNVIAREKRTLAAVFTVVILYIFTAALMMSFVEPNTFDGFIDAMYWATVSVATIGYGDVHPASNVGKILNVASAIMGMAVIALPGGIITAGYINETKKQKKREKKELKKVKKKLNKLQELGIVPDEALLDVVEKEKSPFRFIARFVTKKHDVGGYFNSHPKVKAYLVIMLVSAALELVLALVSMWVNIPGVQIVGTLVALPAAAASIILEPAAGIIVSIMACMYYSLSTQDFRFVYVFVAAVTICLLSGIYLSRSRRLSLRNVLIVVALGTVVIVSTDVVALALSQTGDDLSQFALDTYGFWATAYAGLNLPMWAYISICSVSKTLVRSVLFVCLALLLSKGMEKAFTKLLAGYRMNERRGRAAVFQDYGDYIAAQSQYFSEVD